MVRECERLVLEMGPIVCIPRLCERFIQETGTSIETFARQQPVDLLGRHPGTFLLIGAGRVTLRQLEGCTEVVELAAKILAQAPDEEEGTAVAAAAAVAAASTAPIVCVEG